MRFNILVKNKFLLKKIQIFYFDENLNRFEKLKQVKVDTNFNLNKINVS
jgi:hypothetical protein